MEIEKIYKFAESYGIPIIRSESHKILEEIVKECQPKHILEIGTAIGFSGSLMLEASPEADLITIEHNKEYSRLAKKYFKAKGLNSRVKIKFGDCNYLLAKMVASKKFDGYFDFIFLDGPKAQYNNMLENLIFLLGRGGTLVADNVLFRGYASGEAEPPTKRYKTIVKRLNVFLENAKNHNEIAKFKLIEIEDGMMIAKKYK